jgi:ribosomal protein L10
MWRFKMTEKNFKSKANPKKIKEVNQLADRIKKSKTLMIISIKGLRSRQFQEIKKQIRENVYINVSKKNIMTRAIKEIGNDSVLALDKYIGDGCAFAISNIEGFELAGILASKKTPVYAKAGQIAPADIEVKDGPTNLVPGPAISELGAVGLEISVENGKIAIRKAKVIIKKGETIKENAAAILMKLDIKPFSVGLEPIAVYDIEKGKIYTEIKIDSESARNELIIAAGRALGFAQKISYYCRETIGYLLAKADIGAKSINEKINAGGNSQ